MKPIYDRYIFLVPVQDFQIERISYVDSPEGKPFISKLDFPAGTIMQLKEFGPRHYQIIPKLMGDAMIAKLPDQLNTEDGYGGVRDAPDRTLELFLQTLPPEQAEIIRDRNRMIEERNTEVKRLQISQKRGETNDPLGGQPYRMTVHDERVLAPDVKVDTKTGDIDLSQFGAG